MQPLRFLFSSSGRLPPQPFIVAAIAVYTAAMASHALTVPDVIKHGGFWPFLFAQSLLLWVWFSLHAKRLRDGGGSSGLAAGVSLLYALALVLLVIVAAAFFNTSTADANGAGALGLILLLFMIAALAGSPSYDIAWLVVTILTLMAFFPIGAALGLTIWAATRRSVQERPA